MINLLTNVESVKDYIGINTNTSDSYISSLISDISDVMLTAINRNLIKDTYTEYFDGGKNVIHLKAYPIQQITSIHDDVDRVYGSSNLINSDDYAIYSDMGIIKFDYPTFKGNKNIKVVYVGGYEECPKDLELACKKLVSADYLISRTQNNTQEGMNLIKTRVDTLKEEAKVIIDYYRNYANG